jgi:hypothetical protein
MTKKVALKTFHINAKIALDTSIEIQAQSLEDALTQSKQLNIDDFIEILWGS